MVSTFVYELCPFVASIENYFKYVHNSFTSENKIQM